MLRTTAIVLCFSWVAGSAAAQSAPPSADAAAQEVRSAVRALGDAYARRDTTAVLRLEAAEAMTYYPDGTAGSRADDLAMLRTDSLTIQSIQQDSINVRVYGATAVVTLRRTLAGRVGSTDISGQYKVLAVWVRRDGRWQFVAESLNRLDRR